MKGKFWSNLRKCRILNYVFTILFFGTYFFGCQNSLVYAENTQYKVRNFNNEPNIALEIVDGKVTIPTNPNILRDGETGKSIDIYPNSVDLPTVPGWIFKGWKIITPNVKILSVDYFTMPNSDVDIVGTWGKLGIKKSAEFILTPTFTTGSNINSIMKKLVGGDTTKIEKFSYYGGIPSFESQQIYNLSYNPLDGTITTDSLNGITSSSIVNISMKKSDTGDWEADTQNPIYIWYDDTQKGIYYASLTNNIYLNANSSSMFDGLSNLIYINLGKFKTSKVTNTSRMFRNCSNLKTICVNNKFDLKNVTSSGNMFFGCTNLKGEKDTGYNANNLDKTYARIDGADNGKPGYFTEDPA